MRRAARGKGCQIGFADEAKFYKEETLRSGVLPMLMQGAIIIYASTPEIGANPCEHIINGMWQGEPITEFVSFKLTCDLCEPIADVDPDYICYHRIGWRPPMQDPEIVGITQAAFGNSEAFQREVMANQVRTVDAYIRKEYIERIETAGTYHFQIPPDEIFVAIDPASNSLNWDEGSRSYLGIVSGCFVDGQLVVVSADAFKIHGENSIGQIEECFSEVYRRLRADPMLGRVPILFLIENKYGNDHNLLAGVARAKGFTGYRILCQKPGKIGFDTTEATKKASFGIIRDYASAYGIKFYDHLITFGCDHPPAFTGAEGVRAMLTGQIAQLRQYGKKKARGRDEFVITAIHNKDKKRIASLNDDLLMAFSFIALWGTLQRQGSLDVKPDDVRRMRLTMVHEHDRPAYFERQVAEATRAESAAAAARRRASLFGSGRGAPQRKL